jgi:uncharacterized membrane protein YsdA (DUF1294 family)
MALNSPSLEKTGAWYGFLNGICLIIYAVLLQVLNLVDVTILRVGFIIISLIFICLSISSLKQGRSGKILYLSGLGVGAVTSIVSSVLFGVFTLINIQFFNSQIMDVLRNENIMAEHLTLSSVFMVITMFGIVGGVIGAFIAMQYFKNPDHKVTD